jgi:hypothetical protein
MLWYVLHNPDNDNQPRFLASEIVIFDKIFRHCLFCFRRQDAAVTNAWWSFYEVKTSRLKKIMDDFF